MFCKFLTDFGRVAGEEKMKEKAKVTNNCPQNKIRKISIQGVFGCICICILGVFALKIVV